jgi:predicted 3-demethylubiquinone-9 3-methyltransferase (glyoxalase superfamily)
MPKIHSLNPCLWFDDQAENAARFYTSVFPGSRITRIARYPNVGQEVHGRAPGSVMTVEFELTGQAFTALNGGPLFTFSEAISFQVGCDTQEDIDYFWTRLCDGGSPSQCGWLKDRFGLSWQVFPTALLEVWAGQDARRAERAMRAMLTMQKLDIAALQRAAAG